MAVKTVIINEYDKNYDDRVDDADADCGDSNDTSSRKASLPFGSN